MMEWKKYARNMIRKTLLRQRVRKDWGPYILNIRRKQRPYNAKEFFESYWRATEGFEDRHTINPQQSELHSRFHYNLLENKIFEFLIEHGYDGTSFDVLDVGSGSGHWLSFWKKLGANSVTGIEIAEMAFNKLQNKFKGYGNISIMLGDISDKDFLLPIKVDVISAIGIMFHITDDLLWEIAIKNLSNHMKRGGIAFIGGNFGILTRNVQFHMIDSFRTWDEKREKVEGGGEDVLVNKRLHSRSYWKRVLRKNNCKILSIKRAHVPNNISTPQNNLLIFQKMV